MTLSDLIKKFKPLENLKAWGEVATNPSTRKDYSQYVVKPKVSSFVGKATQPAKAYFNPTTLAKNKFISPVPTYNQPSNFWTTKTAKSLGSFQKKAEEGTLKKVNLQQYADKIKSPIPRVIGKFGAGFGEDMINLPQRLAEAGGRLGVDIRSVNKGEKPSFSRRLGTGAKIALPVLDIATLGGAGVVKEVGKNVVKTGAKAGLKRAVKEGAVSGSLWGSLFGGLQGMSEGDKAEISNVLEGIGVGATLGAVLGGTIGGVGGAIGLLKKGPYVETQLRDSGGKWVAGEIPIKPKGMTKAQWDFQISFNKKYKRNPYTPVYQSDLQKALSYEADKKGVGLSVRDISKDANPLGGSVKEVKPPTGLLDETTALKNAKQGLGEFKGGEVYTQDLGRLGNRQVLVSGKDAQGNIQGWYLPRSDEAKILGQVEGYLQPATFKPKDLQASTTPTAEIKTAINYLFPEKSISGQLKPPTGGVGGVEKPLVKDIFNKGEQLSFQETAKTKEFATRVTPAGNEIVIKSAGKKVAQSIVDGSEDLKDIKSIDMGWRDFYRNTESVLGEKGKPIIESFNEAKADYTNDVVELASKLKTEIVDTLGIKKGSKESSLVQEFGEKDITLEELKSLAPDSWKNVVEADGWFRQTYDKLLDDVNITRNSIGKDPIPKRKDYYRHFQELEGFSGLKKIFENQAAIDPRLAGVSDYTQPISKWLSAAQRRLGIKTDKDAVGGFLDYLPSIAYAKNIDPQIGTIRALRTALAESTQKTKNINNYIEFLNDFSNSLSGKTNPYDRSIQKITGRKVFSLINWANNRIKANTILGNVRSSVVQVFNAPQIISEVGLKNFISGAYETATSPLTKKTFVSKSPFIKERYLNFNEFDTKLIQQPKKFTKWLASVGDRFVAESGWNSFFKKGFSEGLSEADAIKYADDWTRKMVAGRGIGEVPIAQQSKLVNLAAPFQIEVGNVWQVMRDNVNKKEFGKIATLLAYNWLFNEFSERTFGDRVLFDPIDVAWNNIAGKEKDRTVPQKIGRSVGEVLSNVPFGQTMASVYPETGISIGDKQLPTRESLFGDQDPTRYGTGLLLQKGIADPLYKLLPPFGGGQLKKTIGGIKSYVDEASTTKSGLVRFPVEQNPANFIKSLLFGEYSTPEARAYFEDDKRPLGTKQTDQFFSRNMVKDGGKAYYDQIVSDRERATLKTEAKKLKEEGTPVSESLIEKIFGKDKPEMTMLQATAISYDIDLIKKRPTNPIDAVRWDNDVFDKAVKVMGDETLDDSVKEQIVLSLGLNVEDITYYGLAKDDTNVRRAVVDQLVSKATDNQTMIDNLVSLRKEVSGQRVLTNNIIDDLVEEGVLSYQQGKDLKKVEWDSESNAPKIKKSSGSGAKKIKMPASVSKGVQIPKATFSKTKKPSITIPERKLEVKIGDLLKLKRPSVSSYVKPITVKKQQVFEGYR